MGSGKWGCLLAVAVGGVGLVLFALGFDSHTTEAMPFGAILTGVGLFIGVPSLQALRGVLAPGVRPVGKLLSFVMLLLCIGLALVGLGTQPNTTEALPFGLVTLVVAAVLGAIALSARLGTLEVRQEVGSTAERVGAVEQAPPSSVRCENCGSPAPLRLADPTHATCAHCGTRFALPATLAAVLKAAGLAVRARSEAERRISAILQALPEKHVAWRARLLRSSGGLAAIALMVAIFGWTRRYDDFQWFGYVTFGVMSGTIAILLGRSLGRLVPRVAQGIVGHWAALQVPGVNGLACRVCGAALPSVAAPVLRCEYCASDNLAGPSVQALVAQQAGHAVRSVLSVAQRDSKADELAAFSTVAFPVVTLVAWFAVGAFGGGVGGRALNELKLAPAKSEFAVVRVVREGGAPQACVAARLQRGAQLELKFDDDHSAHLAPAELAPYAVEPNVNADWFIGHRANGMGPILEMYTYLRSLDRIEGSQGENLSLYFPYDGLGESFICLDDVAAEGKALKL